MPQQYDHLNTWLDRAGEGLPSDGPACLFGKGSHLLNNVTLMAIFKRVLHQSAEKFPILGKLKVDHNGISINQFEHQFDDMKPREVTEAFHYLMNELLTVLGELTGNILPDSLEREMSALELKETAKLPERLEHLFEISKIFAGFNTIEETFPEIFMILGNSIPFQTILLIEKKDGGCITTVWHNDNTSETQIQRAFNHSRQYYEYLVSPLSHHDVEIYESISKHILPRCSFIQNDYFPKESKFISIPLTLSTLQTFGMLQFECVVAPGEEDLKFLNAVSNLLAITLDRFNKEQDAERRRRAEFMERTRELIQVHQYVRDLEQERDLREQFVSILTHDLRTPLTAAKMAAQVIAKKPERIDKNIALAEKVIFSVNRMDKMIKDLLDANRIRAGESLSFVMTSCDLKEIANETLKDLSVTHGERFVLQADKETIEGFWNSDGIRRVFENLLNNAIKYGCPERSVSLALKQSEQAVEIIVHNFGNPIPECDQEGLFQPFHRSSTAKSGEKKGWGLGLTLVRGVAEAHGGQVKVESNEKDGTSFIVTLPRDSRPFHRQKSYQK